MKKILLVFLLFFTVSTKLSAQTVDDATIKFWYYPSHNVYYSDASGNYWHFSRATTKWISVRELPATYNIMDTDNRYVVSYKDQNVWKENQTHKAKYKVNKNGTEKLKQSP